MENGIPDRPVDGGNLPPLNTKPKNRDMVILESDVLKEVTIVVGDNTYIGKAKTGSKTESPVWQVSRVNVTGGTTTKEWADGNGFFDNIMDDYATLTYK